MGAARRRSEADEPLRELWRIGTIGMRRLDDANGVVLHVTRNGDLSHELLHPEDAVAIENRVRPLHVEPRRQIEDLVELVPTREQNVELEEKAIELRLGKRIRPLHLERVLRREDDERRLQRVRPLADG